MFEMFEGPTYYIDYSAERWLNPSIYWFRPNGQATFKTRKLMNDPYRFYGADEPGKVDRRPTAVYLTSFESGLCAGPRYALAVK